MINNEIKQLVREMKIETVADFGTFQELESIAAELLNSNDTSNKLLAMRIQNRLSENPNYQIFTQRQKIEQEVATEKQEKEILDKKQEIRHSNAAANLETKKKEESKKVEEDRKITESFNKLTEQQQKMVIELEKSFKPEVRSDLRAFLLDETKSTPENLSSIMNKQLGGDYLEVKDGFAEIKKDTPEKALIEAKDVSQKAGDTAYQLGNFNGTVLNYRIVDNAGSELAAKSAEKVKQESLERNKNDSYINEKEKNGENVAENIAKNDALRELQKEYREVDFTHNKNYQKALTMADDPKKEVLLKQIKQQYYNDLLKKIKEIGFNPDDQHQMNIIKISTPELAKQIEEARKQGLIPTNKEEAKIAEKSEVKQEKEQEQVPISKKDDNAEKAKEAKANVEVYNPSVRAQREKEGTAAETQKEVRETYGGSDSDSPVVVVKQENQQTETQALSPSQTTAPVTGN